MNSVLNMNVAVLFSILMFTAYYFFFSILYTLFEKVHVCNSMQLDLGREPEMC